MPQVVFIPAILCLLALLVAGTRSAFLYVLLPVLLFSPTNFFFEMQHLPDLNFVDTAFLVLGLGMIAKELSHWRFTRSDLWLAIWTFSAGYCQYRMWSWNGVGLRMIDATMECVIPYMAGKLLMESGIRLAAVQRFVTLLAVASSIGAIEYFFKKNPYTWLYSRFFLPGQWGGFPTQIRWGFGRLAGPYSQSEFAGLLLMTGLLLTLWLRSAGRQGIESVPSAPMRAQEREPDPHPHPDHPIHDGSAWPLDWDTDRSPCSFHRTCKKPLRRAVLILTLAVLVAAPLYSAGKSYSAGARTDYGSERETTQYRAELIDNYIPLAKLGGAWGWGQPFPTIAGQTSIDNEFLYAWIVQGAVGLGSLILLFAETIATLTRLGIKTKSMNDRSLAFTLLGITLGAAFILSTVFLGAQSSQVFFLIVGWSQAIQISRATDTGQTEAALPPVSSRVHIYT